MPQPIELYFWPTPNGQKVTIFLEEAELPYTLMPVDITAGEQFDEEARDVLFGGRRRTAGG
jgi:GSH-dependent disulfide-bond oxidoreductase